MRFFMLFAEMHYNSFNVVSYETRSHLCLGPKKKKKHKKCKLRQNHVCKNAKHTAETMKSKLHRCEPSPNTEVLKLASTVFDFPLKAYLNPKQTFIILQSLPVLRCGRYISFLF